MEKTLWQRRRRPWTRRQGRTIRWRSCSSALHEIEDRTQVEARCSVLMDWASQIGMKYQYERYKCLYLS